MNLESLKDHFNGKFDEVNRSISDMTAEVATLTEAQDWLKKWISRHNNAQQHSTDRKLNITMFIIRGVCYLTVSSAAIVVALHEGGWI